MLASTANTDDAGDDEENADDEPPGVLVVNGAPVRGIPPAEGRPKLNMLNYLGGKSKSLNAIRALMPKDGIKCFVDSFGGGGSVTMNIGPYKSMVYNDINGDVVNFFRCLRDRTEELKRALALTPYAREELIDARQRMSEGSIDDPIERARLFYVLVQYSYRSMYQKSSATDTSWKGSPIRIGYGSTLKHKVDNIHEYADRWRSVTIDNIPALKVIRNFDSGHTFHFVDPPYMPENRNMTAHYTHEMTAADHEALGEVLNKIKGRAMICSYRSDLYDRIFAGWRRADMKHYAPTRKNYGVESFYMNY